MYANVPTYSCWQNTCMQTQAQLDSIYCYHYAFIMHACKVCTNKYHTLLLLCSQYACMQNAHNEITKFILLLPTFSQNTCVQEVHC